MVEVARSAFEAVTSLSLYVWEQESQRSGGGENTQGEQEICKGLDNLLRCVLEMFLFREFDSGVMEGAGEALFGLVLARGVRSLFFVSFYRWCSNSSSHMLF